jgi:acyl dehydratase
VEIAPALRYFEDCAAGQEWRLGPFVIPVEALDRFLEVVGERHPIHVDEAFAHAAGRHGRIVPGGMLHSYVTGEIGRQVGFAAVIAMRSFRYDFVSPLSPGEPFFVHRRIESVTPIDERVGRVTEVRRILDPADHAYAIGLIDVVLLRRPTAGTEAQ